MEMERSLSLLQFMHDEGLVPSIEEEIKRKNAINKLKEECDSMQLSSVSTMCSSYDGVGKEGILSYQRRLPNSCTEAASATIMTYGSYGLGVHSYESDIDAVCVGPCFATMEEDFFIVLRNIIASTPEVSELHCVKDAKVPIMRFNFDGISIDLSYAKLNSVSVPENVNVHDLSILENMDETSWRSISGVLANRSILQLLPNLELYQSVLRCVKHWAKRRGIYGNLLGFFGGVHLACLTALICERHPKDPLYSLVSVFFQTFAFWPWPAPVSLGGVELQLPQNSSHIETSLMPIQLPCSPNKYCHSNIKRSSFYRIRAEFLRGHALTKDVLRPDFDWKILFEPFLHAKNYGRFLKICLSSSHQDELQDWVGWVKSRIHYLLVKLEESHGFCDPNPTKYVDVDLPEPNAVFYCGLQAGRNHNIDLDSMKEDFVTNILTGYKRPIGKMELSMVKASDLPKMNVNIGSKNVKAVWRTVDNNEQKAALYSKHAPNYFFGYLAADNDDGGYM